ncbi:hypothetical protein LO772_31985 [Yinghuangia sp. ASG 101]|uniref:hypothetical protein n=1 Tax=Yinghuangia sp. ASG 101 TaxID=2896848 RepID=UPI001E5EC68A|nr:hypothetical protein [Yinghuangia sp. ASG 101]UGQ11364.1 hypothetical protein LO772_31985 [Yinghuangia sp. ASG 101]
MRETDIVEGHVVETEDLFRGQLHTEINELEVPPATGVAARAVAVGRRRARRRALGQAAGATLAAGVIAAGVMGAAELRPSPAAKAGPAADPSSGIDGQVGGVNPELPAQPVAPNPLAEQLGPIITSLLPGGTKQVTTNTAVDGGLYATVTWDTGQGVVEVTFHMVGKRFFGCTMADGKPTPKENNFGGCRNAPDGTLLGTFEKPFPDKGIAWKGLNYVTGETMVELTYGNGELSDNGKPTRGTLPLTDEQALSILTNPAWAPILAAYVPPPPADSATPPTPGPTRLPISSSAPAGQP